MAAEPGPPGTPNPAAATPSEESKPSYPVIGRHLTVLRDAASAILTHFARHGEPSTEAAPPSAANEREPESVVRKKNPLTVRIERHTVAINKALGVTTRLNPDRLSRWELSQDVRKDLDWQDQVIRGILDAEVHFWSATLERNPQIQLDETEESWLIRISQLATIVGCSPGNEQHLARVQGWRAERLREHSVESVPDET